MQSNAPQQGEVAVIGASGILAPLGKLLKLEGFRTLGISRGSRLDEGIWDLRTALNTQDILAISKWRSETTPHILVAYAPAVAEQAWPTLTAGISRTVVISTSKWSASDAALKPWAKTQGLIEVALGWADTNSGVRWHTPAEVSEITLSAILDSHTSWLLGKNTPWEKRPI